MCTLYHFLVYLLYPFCDHYTVPFKYVPSETILCVPFVPRLRSLQCSFCMCTFCTSPVCSSSTSSCVTTSGIGNFRSKQQTKHYITQFRVYNLSDFFTQWVLMITQANTHLCILSKHSGHLAESSPLRCLKMHTKQNGPCPHFVTLGTTGGPMHIGQLHSSSPLPLSAVGESVDRETFDCETVGCETVDCVTVGFETVNCVTIGCETVACCTDRLALPHVT